MEELKTYWQTPSIAHFCYLFRDGLKLPKFDYQELELAFTTPVPVSNHPHLDDASQYEPIDDHLIVRIAITLLRGYFNHHHITNQNWEQYLRKIFDLLWVQREGKKSPFYNDDVKDSNPEARIVPFNDLSLKARVEVLYNLCEYRLYAEDSQTLIDHLVEDELRVEPLAEDNKGNIYWYFYGTRLYRENPNAVKRVEQKLSALEKAEKKKKKEAPPPPPSKPKEEPPKKKAKLDYIPGERSSSRSKKPVVPIQINGASSSRTPSKSPVKKSSASAEKEEVRDNSTSCGVPLADLESAWTLLCDTEAEWVNLAETFKKSKVVCEVEFYALLKDNFLPRIHEIYEEAERVRERETKKKLLELLPRRLSSRVQIKKIQAEEDKKKEMEEFEEKKRRNAQAEERARRDHERRHQEEMKRQREMRSQQRLEEIETRAAKARERRERLIEKLNGNVNVGDESDSDEDISDNANAHMNGNADMNGNAEDDEDDEGYERNGWVSIDTANDEIISRDEFFRALAKIISSVMSNRDAWPFKEPVDEKAAPMYYQIIEEPIDLTVIEAKISGRLYETLAELERDFKVLVRNCETFNGPKNGYTLMAYAVWKQFRRATKRYLNRDLDEDEQSVFMYPPKVKASAAVPTAAIEARKKKTLKKHRKGMEALEMLAEASEIAIRENSSRGSSLAPPSPMSSLASTSLDDRATDFLVLDERDNSKTTTTGPISGEVLARYLYNASNARNPNMSGLYVASNDNLTFKSLAEWSESIKKSGNTVILPQNAVVIKSSSATSESSSASFGPDDSEGFVTLQVVPGEYEKMTENSSIFLNANGNSTATNDNGAPRERCKRLVIKLSRCSDSKSAWEPVQILAAPEKDENMDGEGSSGEARDAPSSTPSQPAPSL